MRTKCQEIMSLITMTAIPLMTVTTTVYAEPRESAAPVANTSPASIPASGKTTATTATKPSAALVSKTATTSSPTATVSTLPARGDTRPAIYLDDQERYAAETQKLSNQLSSLNMQEQVELRMKSLRTARGEVTSVSGLPTLIGIAGIDGRLSARLTYPDKSIMVVRAGDRLPSDHMVTGVTMNRVMLRKDNVEIQLPLIFAQSDLVPSVQVQQQRVNVPVDSAGPIVGRQSPVTR